MKIGLVGPGCTVAETWRYGSMVRCWSLDLTADFLARDQELKDIAPQVVDSGGGRWMVQEDKD